MDPLSLLAPSAGSDFLPLPGRLGSKAVYHVRFGSMDIYYYMTPEKDQLARKLIKELNSEKIQLTIDVTSPPCPVSEVSAIATKHPEAIGTDNDSQPVYRDPHGRQILEQYADRVMGIAEEVLKLNISGRSREISFNLNHDALKWHRDYFSHQYGCFERMNPPFPKYTLFQDLTLIDWQMTKNTVSATVVQDGRNGDRFMMVLFPKDVLGTTYAEPAIQIDELTPPKYPGGVTFKYHTAIAPIDYLGSMTPGSSKGKRVSTSTRGLVLTEEIETLNTRVTDLEVNRFATTLADSLECKAYSNGIAVKQLQTTHSLPKEMGWNTKLPDRENVTICKLVSQDRADIVKDLASEFDLSCTDIDSISVYNLSKCDGGFSRFKCLDLPLPSQCEIVIINHSKLPPDYSFFNIAQDWTVKGLPWIQLYRLNPGCAMKVTQELFHELSLTPVEELLYRMETKDATDPNRPSLVPHLETIIEIFVFPPTN